jgi:hypothetical protein
MKLCLAWIAAQHLCQNGSELFINAIHVGNFPVQMPMN